MEYTLELTSAALKDLKALPKNILKKIDTKIQALAKDPRPDGVKKLTDSKDLYRVRVGDFRIVYTIEDDKLVVLVVRIGTRNEIYKLIRRIKRQ